MPQLRSPSALRTLLHFTVFESIVRHENEEKVLIGFARCSRRSLSPLRAYCDRASLRPTGMSSSSAAARSTSTAVIAGGRGTSGCRAAAGLFTGIAGLGGGGGGAVAAAAALRGGLSDPNHRCRASGGSAARQRASLPRTGTRLVSSAGPPSTAGMSARRSLFNPVTKQVRLYWTKIRCSSAPFSGRGVRRLSRMASRCSLLYCAFLSFMHDLQRCWDFSRQLAWNALFGKRPQVLQLKKGSTPMPEPRWPRFYTDHEACRRWPSRRDCSRRRASLVGHSCWNSIKARVRSG